MQSNDSSSDQAASIESAIRGYVHDLLRVELAAEQENQRNIRALEAAGHRIVDGGQTGASSWDVRDWRSGELIESGTGGYEEYLVVSKRLDPDGKWVHIDQVAEGQESAVEDVADLEASGRVPESLARALSDWLGSGSTPDEDVAVVAGWSVEEVHRHRG